MHFYIHILTLIKTDIGNEKQDKYTGRKEIQSDFTKVHQSFPKSASPAQLKNHNISPYGQVTPNPSSRLRLSKNTIFQYSQDHDIKRKILMFKPLGIKISAQVPKCFRGILTTQEDLGSSPAVALSTWNMSGRQMRSIWKQKSDLTGWTRSNEMVALLTPSSAGIPHESATKK